MFASTQLYELRIKEVNQKIKEYNSFLEENKDKRTVVLQNGTKMPKSVYDKYIVAVNSTQQKYNEVFELQDKLAIDFSKIEAGFSSLYILHLSPSYPMSTVPVSPYLTFPADIVITFLPLPSSPFTL